MVLIVHEPSIKVCFLEKLCADRKNSNSLYAVAEPLIMSYLSMIAATPCRALPSSVRASTRTTLPDAFTITSSPCVISRGNVNMISSADPALTSLSITKYSPRVEISRVFPLCVSAKPCAGTRTMIGKERS